MEVSRVLLAFALLVHCVSGAIVGAGSCGYDTTTQTFPLYYGRDQNLIGSTSITLSNTHVSVTYNVDSPCTLNPSDSLHVLLTNVEPRRISPGRFPCKMSTNGGSTQTLTCPLSSFSFSCCDDLRIYTHASLSCPSGSETAFSGSPACSKIKRWCNAAIISPPCNQCGCDSTLNKCKLKSKLCVDTDLYCNTEADVCLTSECTPKSTLCSNADLYCNTGANVCSTTECTPKSTLCSNADLYCNTGANVCSTSECTPKSTLCSNADLYCNTGANVCSTSECTPKSTLCSNADLYCNTGANVCSTSECTAKSTLCSNTDLYCNTGANVCSTGDCVAKKPCPSNPDKLVCDVTKDCCAPCPNCYKLAPGSCKCEIDPASASNCDPCDTSVGGFTGEQICDDLTRPIIGDNSYKCCPLTSNCKKSVIPSRAIGPFDQRSLICSSDCGAMCDKLDASGNGLCTLGGSAIALTPGSTGVDNVVNLCSDGTSPV